MNKIERLIKLRNDIYSWAKIELVGTTVLNIESKITILINNKGLKHTLKGKSYKNTEMLEQNEAMIMSVKFLKDFLKTSKYKGFEKDKRNRDNILGFHIFGNNFEYKGVEYNVKILVRETTDKTFLYDQALIKK